MSVLFPSANDETSKRKESTAPGMLGRFTVTNFRTVYIGEVGSRARHGLTTIGDCKDFFFFFFFFHPPQFPLLAPFQAFLSSS